MEKNEGITQRLLKPTEAAQWLGLHPQTLANFRARGEGPQFVKIGAAVRYDVEVLEAYITACTKNPARRAG